MAFLHNTSFLFFLSRLLKNQGSSLQSQWGLCPPLCRGSALLTGSEFLLSNSLLCIVSLRKGQCWVSLVTEYSQSMATAPGSPYVVCSSQIWFPLWWFQGLCIWIWNPSSFVPRYFKWHYLHAILVILKSRLEKIQYLMSTSSLSDPLNEFLNVCAVHLNDRYMISACYQPRHFHFPYALRVGGNEFDHDLCWPPLSNIYSDCLA